MGCRMKTMRHLALRLSVPRRPSAKTLCSKCGPPKLTQRLGSSRMVPGTFDTPSTLFSGYSMPCRHYQSQRGMQLLSAQHIHHQATSIYVYRLVSYVYPGRSKELLDQLQKKKMTVLGKAACARPVHNTCSLSDLGCTNPKRRC